MACPTCGATPDPAPTAPTAIPFEPPARRRVPRRTSWLAKVLVIAICGGFVWACHLASSTPEGTVKDYFAALAERDAGAARALLAQETRGRRLLDDDTLKHADYTPPSKVHVERLPPPDKMTVEDMRRKTVFVRASYQIGRHQSVLVLKVVPDGPWRILNGLALLPANTRTVSPLVIAGTPVPKSDSGAVLAFPGAYVVRLAEQPLFEAEPVTVIAGESHANGLGLRLRDPYQGELERQVRKYLDTCAGKPEPLPRSCPFERTHGVQYPSTFSRKVIHYPALLMGASSDGTISVIGETQGRVEVSTGLPNGPLRLVTQESFNVRGHLVILEDDRFRFDPA